MRPSTKPAEKNQCNILQNQQNQKSRMEVKPRWQQKEEKKYRPKKFFQINKLRNEDMKRKLTVFVLNIEIKTERRTWNGHIDMGEKPYTNQSGALHM